MRVKREKTTTTPSKEQQYHHHTNTIITKTRGTVAHLKREHKDDEFFLAVGQRVLDEAKASANQQHRHEQQHTTGATARGGEWEM